MRLLTLVVLPPCLPAWHACMQGTGRPGPPMFLSVRSFIYDAHHTRLLAVPAALYAVNNSLKFRCVCVGPGAGGEGWTRGAGQAPHGTVLACHRGLGDGRNGAGTGAARLPLGAADKLRILFAPSIRGRKPATGSLWPGCLSHLDRGPGRRRGVRSPAVRAIRQ